MKYLPRKLSVTALSFALCSGVWAQQVLQPAETCRDNSAYDIVTFADSVLDDKVREALSLGPHEPLTCEVAGQLTKLDASGAGARLRQCACAAPGSLATTCIGSPWVRVPDDPENPFFLVGVHGCVAG